MIFLYLLLERITGNIINNVLKKEEDVRFTHILLFLVNAHEKQNADYIIVSVISLYIMYSSVLPFP